MGTPNATSAVLRLRWPLGVSSGVALLLALTVAGAGEIVARAGILESWLPPPSIGSGQAQLDAKFNLLAGRLKFGQGVDVIFLGNSQVHRGIDPVHFGEAFQQEAGAEIRSFNFGLGGAAEMSLARLARILADKARPKFIVAGTSSFGLAEDRGLKFAVQLGANPWFRYHEGHFSVDGWLIDSSAGFRQYLGCLFWWEKRSKSKQNSILDSLADLTDNGYAPAKVGPFRKLGEHETRRLRTYEVSLTHLEALSSLLSLSSGIQNLVVELPVPESTVSLYGRGAADHQQALFDLEQVAAKRGAPFWRFPATSAIPAEGWYDYAHLNRIGAETYSRWLGGRLGEAVREGRLKL